MRIASRRRNATSIIAAPETKWQVRSGDGAFREYYLRFSRESSASYAICCRKIAKEI
jgi:hypothetical protein